VLLANHCAVTYGPTIEVAYDRALYLEWVAEVWLRAHALAPPFTPPDPRPRRDGPGVRQDRGRLRHHRPAC
jgi:ribulose-5-phosphate 4-epimerase/fuculose-1-phosphate aldolase